MNELLELSPAERIQLAEDLRDSIEPGRMSKRGFWRVIGELGADIRPEAETEIVEASDWYEQRSPGPGAKFINATEMTLLAVQQNPFQYQLASGQLRRAKLRRFPYGLLYVMSGREITVVSRLHGRRDPKTWQERS